VTVKVYIRELGRALVEASASSDPRVLEVALALLERAGAWARGGHHGNHPSDANNDVPGAIAGHSRGHRRHCGGNCVDTTKISPCLGMPLHMSEYPVNSMFSA
jgi:hypothetical protein